MIKKITTTFDFGKLAKFVESESFRTQVNKILGGGIIESSRAFMKSGGVTPKLEKSTIDIRRARGTGGTTPIYETGALAKSLKAKKEGIWGLHYGKDQYEGFTTHKNSMIPNKVVPPRNFIAMDSDKMAKPINTLMKKIGKALKK